MKKLTGIAIGLAAMFSAGKAAAVQVINDHAKTTVKSEIAPTSKRKQEKKSTLEPAPLPDFNKVFPAFTSPFYNPTRSQRVKNKLNRKYYR